MPEVSVIIPTYNSGATIGRAVESVLEQTYQSVEIIVVDDGSTDNTRELLQPYAAHVSYVHQVNQGRSAARNHGIARAISALIAFLDADDWWTPDKLEQQVRILQHNPGTALVHCGYFVVRPSGWVEPVAIRQRGGDNDSGSMLFDRLVFRNIIGSPSFVLVRSDVLRAVGGFDESLHGSEDWDLWLRIGADHKLAYIAQPMAYYQLNENDGVERVLARNVQGDWPRIMERLFADPGIRARYGHLEGPARARVLLRCALLDMLVKRNHDGLGKLWEAVKLDRTLFAPPYDKLNDLVIEYAGLDRRSRTSLDQALGFVDRVWASLPDVAGKGLPTLKRQAKGRLCETWFFSAQRYGDTWGVRKTAPYALWYEPGLLTNPGFWSIWVRSVVFPEHRSARNRALHES